MGRLHGRVSLAYLYIGLLLALLALTSCATLPDPETSQNFSAHTVATLDAAHRVGQTFTVRRSRLNGIALWLAPQTSAPLQFELFRNPEETEPLFAGQVRPAEGYTHIAIPPQQAPSNQTYYLELSVASGEIGVLGRAEDIYAEGAAFVDDRPLKADLAFRTTYEYDWRAALSDLGGILALWDVLLPLGLMLLLPGWLLLDFTALKSRLDFGERVALALGGSLALIPLLMLWTAALGLRWGRVFVWASLIAMLALALWRGYRVRRTGGRAQRSACFAVCALLAIFGLALFLRFAMVRDLAAPAWVDSVHHALITRLILESGGHPGSFAPYLPAGADHYHFGFHSGLAAFIWLTGLEIPDAMLIYGQALNALMVFPVYLLAKTLTRSRPAALTAALIVAAFTLMPAYYASWGRYTQLAGLLILPALFALVWSAIRGQPPAEREPRAAQPLGVGFPVPVFRDLLPAALVLAGLFLVHYRVTAFWGALALAALLVQLRPRRWPSALGWLALLGAGSALLLAPWLPATLVNLLIPTGKALSGGQPQLSGIPWGFLRPGLGIPALWMALIGLVLGFGLGRRFPFTVLLCTAFWYLMANLGVFARIPGAGFINPVSMEIALFMPIAVLGGFAVGGGLEIVDRLAAFLLDRGDGATPRARDAAHALQTGARALLVILGGAAGVLGAQRLLPTLNPDTFLAREADFPAIRWINENIPADEPVLINPAAWGYGLYMGNDGGFWISALTPHPTLPPPVLYGMGTRAEIEHVNGVVEAVQAAASDPEALWGILESEGIRFVYLGARGGAISPRALEGNPKFIVRYHEGATWVFETQP